MGDFDVFEKSKLEFEISRGCKDCCFWGRVGDAPETIPEECLYGLNGEQYPLPCDPDSD